MSDAVTVELRGRNITATEVVRPGDTLIVAVDSVYDDKDIEEIAGMFCEHAPGVHIVMIQRAVSVDVIRASAPGGEESRCDR